jgi:tetratricopeptide (TPR) repeat protein
MDLERIRDLRSRGHNEQARALLLQMARERPQDARVQYETACVHDALGHEREAVPYYVEALRLGLSGDERRSAYLGLGSTYRVLGQYQEAKETLLAGLAQFPDAAELRVFLAMSLYNLGDYHAATATLLTVIAETSRDPHVRAYERAIRLYAEDLDRRWG